MVESFYSLFEPTGTDWETWNNSGFFLGFITVLGISLLTILVYYLLLGRATLRFASIGSWFLFMTFNSVLIFLVTSLLCGYVAFENIGGFKDFQMDIWVFSTYNATVYAWSIFLFFSLIFNNFSLHHRYLPFRITK